MSKAPTGFFSATKGDNSFYGNAEALIANRVEGLDLREHTLPYKQLNSKLRKRIKTKIATRTAAKDEYRRFMWDRRFRQRRKKGVNEFWRRERIRLLQGFSGLRNWDETQKLSIIKKRPPSVQRKDNACTSYIQ